MIGERLESIETSSHTENTRKRNFSSSAWAPLKRAIEPVGQETQKPNMGTWQNFELSCACMRAIKSRVLEDGKNQPSYPWFILVHV